MHFSEIPILAGRVNKKAGSYIHDAHLAAACDVSAGYLGIIGQLGETRSTFPKSCGELECTNAK